ncbi:MAG: S46 family peptidase [Planctomycetes bacterium]|nr:S46 family peptidase [Planctomycetota bacterium]
MNRRFPWLLALLALPALPAPARAQDELGLGKMWTFERPPLAYLQREYGFQPAEQWWNRVRLASLRFGRGCSASFVSPQGLILTNHHCVRDAIAQVQGDNDWVRDGFVAADLAGEVRVPGLTVQQLVKTTDVTAAVTAGIAADAGAEAAEQQRAVNRERLLAEAKAREPGLEPQLVKLFQGAVWQLYQYRVFDDVRLVMAPHLQVSHFGGDPDNFVYPRYAIDFAFCRAWVDGKPADTAAFHFPWSDGPAEGELVFLTGNPGGTQRLLTRAQLEYQRDARYPRVREQIDNRIAILRRFAAQGPELEKRLRTVILGLENGQKLYRGEHGALLDPAFMGRKQAAETAFQARAKGAGHGGELVIWEQLAQLMVRKKALEAPLNFHTAGGLPLLLRALAVVEHGETGAAKAAQTARDVDCKVDPVQVAFYADHWLRARARLPQGDPVLAAALGGREPEAAAKWLVETSRLGDSKVLEGLLQGGSAAIAASQDPALVLARALGKAMAEHRAAAAAIDAAETQLGARLANLLFAVYGNDVTPDATFTLRISDGRVAGYPYNGTLAPWRTVFHGLFARHAEFDGAHPFDLPEPWLLAKDRIDMRAAVDFVCTVDSTGGNSGSPVIDKQARLVGLLFDGNVESFANEFLYGERVERSICVHPQAIVEALRKVYRAERLLREIAR